MSNNCGVCGADNWCECGGCDSCTCSHGEQHYERLSAKLRAQLSAATARAEAAEAKVARLLARRFPVLDGGMTVPWQMLVPHEPQAMRNHSGQTLEELAQRCGLDWVELACVLNGKPFTRCPTEHAKEFVLKRVAEYEAAQWVRENSPPQKKPTDEGGRGGGA